MDHFLFKQKRAYCEDVSLASIAEETGTPAYVYSSATLRRHCQALRTAFASYPTLACYAVKANSNLSVLKEIFSQGFGADCVSVGELERALLSGAKPSETVFSGVGKRKDEMERALQAGILSFNLESHFELGLLKEVSCKVGKKMDVSIRVNPHIDAKTNPYIATGLYETKFGMAEEEMRAALAELKNDQFLNLIGLTCHIGSQITEIRPFEEAAKRMSELALQVMKEGFALKLLSLGGGLGIPYTKEATPSVDDYAKALIGSVKQTGLKLVIEPGRSLVGNAGVLLTRVLGIKKTPKKHFVVVDAGMNDLIRPALYEAYHEILAEKEAEPAEELVDVVGPVCESGDFFGKDRKLAPVVAGDLVYVRSTGAYGMTMASNYNTRPRAVEVLVEGSKYKIVRRRETLESLWREELGL